MSLIFFSDVERRKVPSVEVEDVRPCSAFMGLNVYVCVAFDGESLNDW